MIWFVSLDLYVSLASYNGGLSVVTELPFRPVKWNTTQYDVDVRGVGLGTPIGNSVQITVAVAYQVTDPTNGGQVGFLKLLDYQSRDQFSGGNFPNFGALYSEMGSESNWPGAVVLLNPLQGRCIGMAFPGGNRTRPPNLALPCGGEQWYSGGFAANIPSANGPGCQMKILPIVSGPSSAGSEDSVTVQFIQFFNRDSSGITYVFKLLEGSISIPSGYYLPAGNPALVNTPEKVGTISLALLNSTGGSVVYSVDVPSLQTVPCGSSITTISGEKKKKQSTCDPFDYLLGCTTGCCFVGESSSTSVCEDVCPMGKCDQGTCESSE
jgi:hypothetical protein